VLAGIGAAWVVGLFVGAQWQSDAGLGLVAAAVLGAGALAMHGQELRAQLWVVPLSLFAFSAGLGVAHHALPSCSSRGEVSVSAAVDSVRYGVDEARVRLRVIDGRWVPSNERVREGLLINTRLPLDAAPPSGSTVRFLGKVHPPTVLRNRSPKPTLTRTHGGACWGQAGGGAGLKIISASHFQKWIDRARQRVRRRMVDRLPEEVASVARALVLGDGAALAYEQRQTIAAVGLAHLFAVSGLHIALVSGTLVRGLHWLIRGCIVRADPLRIAAAVGIPLTLLHATFAGGSPSAWRAAVTAALTWSVVLLGRRSSATAVTAAAAMLLSVPEPSMALRPAFLLSIVATTAILSAPNAKRGRWKWVRAASTVSARTLVATAPMVWWWFGGVPLIGWLTNIIVLPFGSLVVIPLAHFFALFAEVPHFGEWVSALLSGTVHLLLVACDVVAPLAITQRLPPLDATQGLTVLAACIGLLMTRRWRARLAITLIASLIWFVAEHRLIEHQQPRGVLRVAFLDVGQGDATLVDFPDGSLVLIDTGQGGRHPAGREIIRLLRERRRARIDRLIITHGHPDHFGALPQLLDEIDVGQLWVNGQLLAEESDGTMQRLLVIARSRGTEVRFVQDVCGSHSDIGGAYLAVLWPCPRYDPELDLNDNSIVLRVSFGAHSFLFTGDLEAEAERRLLHQGRLSKSDVLKVAHHGSKTSTIEELVDVVRPNLAVASMGANNLYGHPSLLVIDRLQNAGARVFRTDRDGGVTVETDGTTLEVHTWRGDMITLSP